MKRCLLVVLVLFALLLAAGLTVRKIQTDEALERVPELRARVDEEIRAFLARERPRPPLFLPAAEGTAGECYRRAQSLGSELTERLPDDTNVDICVLLDWRGLPFALPEGADRYLDAIAPALRLIRQGASTTDGGLASLGWPSEDPEDYETLLSLYREVAAALRESFDGRSFADRLIVDGLARSLDHVATLGDRLDESRETLLLNLALHRYREREGRDPDTIAEILPAGVRETTSEGPWEWRSDPVAPQRWIERGVAKDVRERDSASASLVSDLLISLDDRARWRLYLRRLIGPERWRDAGRR